MLGLLMRMVLGIDISKRSMDVLLLKGKESIYQRFNNSAAGIAE
jgi:hypothetical protein